MLPTPEPVVALERSLDGRAIRAWFNTSGVACDIECDAPGTWEALGEHGLVAGTRDGTRVQLPAYGVLFLAAP